MPRIPEVIVRFKRWIKLAKNHDLFAALRNHPAIHEEAVKRACKAFGLDANSQIDRGLLLRILADVHFPDTSPRVNALALQPPKQPGRPVKWTAAAVSLLVSRVKEVCPDSPPYPEMEKLAELLRDKFPDDYRSISAKTLAEYLDRGPPGWK